MLNIALGRGPKAATNWSFISWVQRPQGTITRIAPAHLVLIQLSAINERQTAVASDKLRAYRPTRGAIELVPSGVDHKAAWDRPKNSIFFGLRADALEHLAEREIGRTSIDLAAPPLGTIDNYILHLAELMRLHFENGGVLADVQADAISTLLAIHILKSYSSRPRLRPSTSYGGLRPASKRAILELMEARIATGVTIAELAEISDLSISHFMRAFKNEFGLSPHRYLIDLRIEAAADAMRSTALPLAQIAVQSGFSSQSHMTAAFSRFRHTTPGEIRRRR